MAFGAALVLLRTGGHRALSAPALVMAAVRWLPWLVAAPLSLAAASDLRARDREDGILALAYSRGLNAREMDAARALAAMLECAWCVGLPLATIAVLGAIADEARGSSLWWAQATISTVAFASVFGLTLGGVASACGRIAGRQGPSLLGAVVVGPWLFAKVTGLASVSIPSALGALVGLFFGMRTV
jgi:hypothetical protein